MTRVRSAAADADGETRVSSSDQMVREVLRGLYEGRYVAGQRLAEPDLMRRHNVGRSTVREALKRLAAEGVVTLLPFRGAQIRHLSRPEARNALLVMELMVGLAARQAAANIARPGSKDLFLSSVDDLFAYEQRRDSYEFIGARNRFYSALTRISANRELARLLPSIQIHLIRTYLKMPLDERFADYRHLVDAVLAGDEDAAEAAGRFHVRATAEALDQLPDHAFAPEDTEGSAA